MYVLTFEQVDFPMTAVIYMRLQLQCTHMVITAFMCPLEVRAWDKETYLWKPAYRILPNRGAGRDSKAKSDTVE